MADYCIILDMRLDKFLCDSIGVTRSEAKKLIDKGVIAVNDKIIKKSDYKIDENNDSVTNNGKTVVFEKYVYYMLNKPAGIVSANTDNRDITVIDLFKGEGKKNLSCVGRLDKDTTGLLLVTDDGNLLHKLTSPKKQVYKEYLVGTKNTVTSDMAHKLEMGVDIGDEKITLPAKVEIIDEKTIILSITEGRFHQVKRMLQAVGNEVVSLHRKSLGNVVLDYDLAPGKYRRLTKEELSELMSY